MSEIALRDERKYGKTKNTAEIYCEQQEKLEELWLYVLEFMVREIQNNPNPGVLAVARAIIRAREKLRCQRQK